MLIEGLDRSKRAFDNLTGYFNILLPGHEDQDIPGRVRQMDLESLFDRAINVVLTRCFAEQYVHRKRSPGNGKIQRIIKEA